MMMMITFLESLYSSSSCLIGYFLQSFMIISLTLFITTQDEQHQGCQWLHFINNERRKEIQGQVNFTTWFSCLNVNRKVFDEEKGKWRKRHEVNHVMIITCESTTRKNTRQTNIKVIKETQLDVELTPRIHVNYRWRQHHHHHHPRFSCTLS